MPKKSYPWLKPGIWGAIIGAIVIMVVGFWQFGWVLGSKADQMARDRASTAVAEALAPVCAAKLFAQPDAPARVADLKNFGRIMNNANLSRKAVGQWRLSRTLRTISSRQNAQK